jgi:hypothetical protein
MKSKDQLLLEEAYGEVSANQSKKRLLARIKPEFRKLYIKDLEHFNGSYRDHADFLNKAKEMGHLVKEAHNEIASRQQEADERSQPESAEQLLKQLVDTIALREKSEPEGYEYDSYDHEVNIL